jgi:hypothetical protein
MSDEGATPAVACFDSAKDTACADHADHRPDHRRASHLLLAMALQSESRLSFDELLHSLGDRGFGVVLLILALINCMPMPPGGSSVFGATMMVVAAQFIVGRHRLWIPGFVRRRSVSREMFRVVVERVAPYLQRIERLCRPRHEWLTSGVSERVIGLAVLILAFVISLPIPIVGNIPPSLSVAILAIALIERDGLAVLVGMACGTLAFLINLGVVTAIVAAVWEGVQRLSAGG